MKRGATSINSRKVKRCDTRSPALNGTESSKFGVYFILTAPEFTSQGLSSHTWLAAAILGSAVVDFQKQWPIYHSLGAFTRQPQKAQFQYQGSVQNRADA